MVRERLIDAYLNRCILAEHSAYAVFTFHNHMDRDGIVRSYVGQGCLSSRLVEPQPCRLSEFRSFLKWR